MHRLWEGHHDALQRFAATALWQRSVSRFLEFAAPVWQDQILEIGCGSRLLSPWLRSRGGRVHAVGERWDDVRAARAVDGVEAVRGADESLPFASASFSLACCALALLSPQDVEAALRVVRPGGSLAVLVPAAGLDVDRILMDPSVMAMEPEPRQGLAELLAGGRAQSLTDVEVARLLSSAPTVAIRTAELMDGALIMAKARRR